ncbi:MAG: CDP-alcohol phosphatidyltransferase family protein [Aggregatilineales bacterium]
MLDKSLREIKEVTLLPVANQIGTEIHPIAISLVGLIVGCASAVVAYLGVFPLALILLWINRFLDGLDGTVARNNKTQSDLGGYIDIQCDFVIYSVIPIALAIRADDTATYIATMFLLGAFYVSAPSWMYLAAIFEKRNQGAKAQKELTSTTMPAGLIEGTEAVIFYSLFLIFPGYSALLFTLLGVMVTITIAQRIIWAAKHLE